MLKLRGENDINPGPNFHPVMITIIEKSWPMSVGDGKASRRKKPKILAITTDCCTGCSGSPVCIEYCPIEACMFWVSDSDHTPFGRIEVDPNLCIGCQKCISKGPDGAFLDGGRRVTTLRINLGMADDQVRRTRVFSSGVTIELARRRLRHGINQCG